MDTKDGFTCICPPWQEDCTYGKRVLFIKEKKIFVYLFFLASNVGCSCRNGGRCIMGLGTYICECPYGYNGLSCETSKINSRLNKKETSEFIS